ncbi:Metalloprotease StcE [Aeromonas salmonicida]
MWDGNWTRNIQLPLASAVNRGRIVTVDHDAGYNSTLFINGQQITVSRGFKKSYTSDGARWNEGPLADLAVERKPDAFGVLVTTLVGYYDPQRQLPGYLYPALHGAYGFTYGDDSERLGGLPIAGGDP